METPMSGAHIEQGFQIATIDRQMLIDKRALERAVAEAKAANRANDPVAESFLSRAARALEEKLHVGRPQRSEAASH
jgi:hypothetical protein